MKSQKKKIIITLTICIISLLLIMAGSTAAFFYNYTGGNNKSIINNVELEFLESDTKIINIPTALPMSDEEGKKQDETFTNPCRCAAGEQKLPK